MFMMRKLKLLLGFIITLSAYSYGELFTALADIEPLLATQKKVVDDLHDYITKEEQRLHILKRYLKMYKEEHVKAMDDIPNYLGNPINAFILIKKMTTDLQFVKMNIDLGAGHASNIGITEYEDTYPTDEDLRGAASALTRLQETYLLKVEDLADGILNGVSYGFTMSAGDCFVLGKALYNEKDYTNSLAWMLIALRKYSEENYSYPFSQVDILEYISFAHYLLRNLNEAEEWMQKLIAIDPTHTLNLTLVAGNTAAKQEENKKGIMGETEEEFHEDTEEQAYEGPDKGYYEALCRGEMDISPVITKELTCRYLTENHPFLRLAPIKMEYKYRDPNIVLFYDVLSDHETEHIKELAKPRFKRAEVCDESGEFIPVDYRISKSAWLSDAESQVVARVTRRVADFTGLDMDTAEFLQVVNYGIGGHYMPHYDFATSDDKQFEDEIGNRIATVIFYMSDVAQGGATVFTELGLSLFPVRGAAAVWMNLHASGEGDLATRHAACPVLRGSKWVSNKWIHLVGQEFRKPCGLEYQTEDMERPLIEPVTK